MTNKEAVETLKANYPDACYGQLREAVDAAIEALKAQDADSDTISRKAAIDAILAVTGNSSVRELYEHVQEHGLSDMWSGGVNAAIDIAQPTLYGYNIEHLELIARVLQKEDLPPERVVEVLTDVGRIVAIVRDEFEETLRKAVEQCMT